MKKQTVLRITNVNQGCTMIFSCVHMVKTYYLCSVLLVFSLNILVLCPQTKIALYKILQHLRFSSTFSNRAKITLQSFYVFAMLFPQQKKTSCYIQSHLFFFFERGESWKKLRASLPVEPGLQGSFNKLFQIISTFSNQLNVK